MSSDNKLWQFSLDLYAEPEVQKACLSLQDNHSADVNLVLFLLYRGSLGMQLSQATIQVIDNESCSFREQVIQPIRAVRKTLKGKQYSVKADDGSLYQQMLSIELSAEKIAQAQLAAITFDAVPNRPALQAAKTNVYHYAELLGVEAPNSDLDTLLAYLKV